MKISVLWRVESTREFGGDLFMYKLSYVLENIDKFEWSDALFCQKMKSGIWIQRV